MPYLFAMLAVLPVTNVELFGILLPPAACKVRTSLAGDIGGLDHFCFTL